MWSFLYWGLGLALQTQIGGWGCGGEEKKSSNYPPRPCGGLRIYKYSSQAGAAGSFALLSQSTPSGHTHAFESSFCQTLASSSLVWWRPVDGCSFQLSVLSKPQTDDWHWSEFFGRHCSMFFVSTPAKTIWRSFVKCEDTRGANSKPCFIPSSPRVATRVDRCRC